MFEGGGEVVGGVECCKQGQGLSAKASSMRESWWRYSVRRTA
jgi:hypothetical protein